MLMVHFRLYGMTTLQAFIYYQTYPNDSRALKYLVRSSTWYWIFPSHFVHDLSIGCCCLVSPLLSSLVALLLIVALFRILETVHTGFCMQFMYSYLVKGFGNYINFLIVNQYVSMQNYSILEV